MYWIFIWIFIPVPMVWLILQHPHGRFRQLFNSASSQYLIWWCQQYFLSFSHYISFVLVNKSASTIGNNPSFHFLSGYSLLTEFDLIWLFEIFDSVTTLLTVFLFIMQGFSSLDLIFSILVQEISFNCGSELPQARNSPNFFPQASPQTCPLLL